MSDRNGWISLQKQIQNHWIWKDPIKFQWWIDILLTVNFSTGKVNIGNEIFECLRGQSLISLQNWGIRWKVSKDTARNFLKLLEKDHMIKMESLGKSTRITVCNYDKYQLILPDSRTQSKRTTNDKQTHSDTTNKEDNNNNENNDNKNNLFEEEDVFCSNIELKKVFEAFIKMRKQIKKPLTDHASDLIKKDVWKFSEKKVDVAIDILNYSIKSSYPKVYDPKTNKNKQNESNRTISGQTTFGKF